MIHCWPPESYLKRIAISKFPENYNTAEMKNGFRI
jgi:hypothetical protein